MQKLWEDPNFGAMDNTIIQKEEIERILLEYLPQISSVELRQAISTHGKMMHVESGEILMDIGNVIRSIPILLDGSIKVLREDDNGNEILLYYLASGETCAVSLTCCMSSEISSIKAVTNETVRMIQIPVRYGTDEATLPRSTQRGKEMEHTRFGMESHILTTIDNL
ncbi:MAG: hypothetical protein ACI9YU_000916 [Flavobacteriales bacterium]|jgi:hypothetical protein